MNHRPPLSAVPALLALSTLFAAAPSARAGGFLIYEHSAQATGMASVRTALWDSPSSLFYNPAAITELEGFQLSLGDTLIRPHITYTPLPPDQRTDDLDGIHPAVGESRLFYPLHVYFTAEVLDWLTVGISVTNPFGLGTYWPEDWDGRYTAYQTELRTFFVQPVVAFDFAEAFDFPEEARLSLAVAGQYVYSDAMIHQKVQVTPTFDVQMELEGDGHSGGYGFSLFAAWFPWISIGASVRSNVVVDYEGTAAFTGMSPETRAGLAMMGIALPESTPGGTSIEMPWNMNFGIGFHAIPNLTIAADLYVALWESYDELTVNFACAHEDPPTCWGELASPALTTFPKKWKTAYQASVALEYRPTDFLALRAGYGYVTDPTDPEYYDAMLPDGDRHLITFGIGARAPDLFRIDVGYMLAMWDGVKHNEVGAPSGLFSNGHANGTYETVSHLLGITLSFSFDDDGMAPPPTLDPPTGPAF
jgi:long-chain fatty acid transport protein